MNKAYLTSELQAALAACYVAVLSVDDCNFQYSGDISVQRLALANLYLISKNIL